MDYQSASSVSFMIVLTAPQQIGIAVQDMWKHWPEQLESPFLLPPAIPLLNMPICPPPPVPGLLPPCDEPFRLKKELHSPCCTHWWFWEPDDFGWINSLIAFLKYSDTHPSIIPTGSGIIVASRTNTDETDQFVSLETFPPVIFRNGPKWRVMKLACWEINFRPDVYPIRSIAWRTVWERRLKRAP